MSDKIHIATCKHCKEQHELLDDYLYYLKQYLKQEPRAVVPCRNCGLELHVKNIRTEKKS